jgi:hypothetical protein
VVEVVAVTFGLWLGFQMDRVGIRSGRRLALETGFEEEAVLDWATGRRIPSEQEVRLLARFFGQKPDEALKLRARDEEAKLAKLARR